MTFGTFGHAKVQEEEKLLYVSSRVVDGADPYKIKSEYSKHPE